MIIGQIHAIKDEPIRLYYRKLPGNEKGAVYFAHEINGGDGIALGELFSYKISVEKDLLVVTLSREGKDDEVATYDMTGSQYDDPDQYMYFKVGVYHVNNSSDPSSDTGQFAQATFYEIRNSHDGYVFSE